MNINDNLKGFLSVLDKFVAQPQGNFGVDGFVFDIETETTATLQAEITDHPMEDASFVQDHVIRRPKKITLRGYQGELVYNGGSNFTDTMEKAPAKLSFLSDIAPILSPAVTQAVNNAAYYGDKADYYMGKVLDKTNSLTRAWDFFEGKPTYKSRQQQAFQFFNKLWETGTLVSVHTPFDFYQNMIIETVTATQSQDTDQISDFSVTLKQINTASIKVKAYSGNKTKSSIQKMEPLQNRAALQGQPSTNIGIIEGQLADLESDNEKLALSALDQAYKAVRPLNVREIKIPESYKVVTDSAGIRLE